MSYDDRYTAFARKFNCAVSNGFDPYLRGTHTFADCACDIINDAFSDGDVIQPPWCADDRAHVEHLLARQGRQLAAYQDAFEAIENAKDKQAVTDILTKLASDVCAILQGEDL